MADPGLFASFKGLVGAFFKGAAVAFRRATHRARMEDIERMECLREMKKRLQEINPAQSRPANRECIQFCYDHRHLLNDQGAVERLESAQEYLTRNLLATFENPSPIAYVCEQIRKEMYFLQTK